MHRQLWPCTEWQPTLHLLPFDLMDLLMLSVICVMWVFWDTYWIPLTDSLVNIQLWHLCHIGCHQDVDNTHCDFHISHLPATAGGIIPICCCTPQQWYGPLQHCQLWLLYGYSWLLGNCRRSAGFIDLFKSERQAHAGLCHFTGKFSTPSHCKLIHSVCSGAHKPLILGYFCLQKDQ